MAKFNLNPGKVPIPQPTQPFQIPESRDNADIIFQSAQLAQQREQLEEARKQKALESLNDVLKTTFDLQQRRRESEITEKKVDAIIELQKAQVDFLSGAGQGPKVIEKDGREFVEVRTKSGIRYQPLLPDVKTIVDPETGQTIELPRGSQIYSPPGVSKARETESKINSMLRILDEQEKVLKKVPSGRAAGTAANVLNVLTGYNPYVKQARGLGSVLLPQATRIVGGDVGNLNEFEQRRMSDALAQISGTNAERAMAINTMREILLDKRAETQSLRATGLFKSGSDKVEVISPEGKRGLIHKSKLAQAQKRGFKVMQ